jgi:hypothetical protein
MAGARGVRRLVRWGLRHGVPRVAMARRARAGDLGARIMFDTGRIGGVGRHPQSLGGHRQVGTTPPGCSVLVGVVSGEQQDPGNE